MKRKNVRTQFLNASFSCLEFINECTLYHFSLAIGINDNFFEVLQSHGYTTKNYFSEPGICMFLTQ